MSAVNLKDYHRNKWVINVQDITCLVTAIMIFLAIDPFFVWSSFAGGIGLMAYKAIQVVAIGLLAWQLFLKPIPVNKFLCGVAVFAIFLFYCAFTGVVSGTTHPFLIGNVLLYLFYALNVMMDRKLLIKSFDFLTKIFAVVLGYTLIIHILLLIGVPIPYTLLQSGEAGRTEIGRQFYHNYFGCLLINQNYRILYRFTSVFTEPGVVGTFCAFFLAADDCKLKNNKRNMIFLISGLLSLSVAFYVMLVLIYGLKALRNGGYKLFVGLAAIVILYVVFLNIPFSNPSLQDLQGRLTITEEGLAGDNRIKEAAEEAYQRFLQSDPKTVLLGYGAPNSRATAEAWQLTASYKESVYCLGVLGYGLMIAWFILTPLVCYKTKDKGKNRMMYCYMTIFILSQYQRPYMKAWFLVYILLAGCVHAQQVVEQSALPGPKDTGHRMGV